MSAVVDMQAHRQPEPQRRPDKRPSLRSIRSLLRGLECLEVLIGRDGATVSDIAARARLPRTTTHRILETLCEGGYVVRDPADECYRATVLVRALADGFIDEGWIAEVARPALETLCRQVVYPVFLCTPSGLELVVRETTDALSPLAIERYRAGMRIALAGNAAGRLYLAMQGKGERSAMLDVLQRAAPRSERVADRAALERELDQIRDQGYALHHAPPSREATIAIPLEAGGQLVALLGMRYIASALTSKEVVGSHLPQLRATAEQITGAVLR